jgi:pimeloyl-ACP methyl ester carboxylesterase
VVEAEVSADVARSLRLIYFGGSGNADRSLFAAKAADAALLDGLVDPDPFPSWLTPDDLQISIDAFEAGGWVGAFNRYRAQGIDAAQIGPMPDGVLTQPAAFIGGELDGVRHLVPGADLYESAGGACADFRGTTIVPGVGHWVQQEAPGAVNAALDSFVDSL